MASFPSLAEKLPWFALVTFSYQAQSYVFSWPLKLFQITLPFSISNNFLLLKSQSWLFTNLLLFLEFSQVILIFSVETIVCLVFDYGSNWTRFQEFRSSKSLTLSSVFRCSWSHHYLDRIFLVHEVRVRHSDDFAIGSKSVSGLPEHLW